MEGGALFVGYRQYRTGLYLRTAIRRMNRRLTMYGRAGRRGVSNLFCRENFKTELLVVGRMARLLFEKEATEDGCFAIFP